MAKTVAHVDLTDHVVNIVFTLFDENGKCNSFNNVLPRQSPLSFGLYMSAFLKKRLIF